MSPASPPPSARPGRVTGRATGRSWAVLAATGVAVAAWGLAVGGVGVQARPALATVVHHTGFEATVLGWTSWYGDYDLGSIGSGWCIDHGLRAPDASFVYRPTPATDLRDDTRAAMAWAVTTAGSDAGRDPVRSAALMLVLHDLRGAVYPYGQLDVDALTPVQLAGFGGHEGQVIATAQAIKADALAHAARRGPLALHLVTQATGPLSGQVVATLTDATGSPVAGASLALSVDGASLGPPSGPATGPDGQVTAPFVLPAGWTTGGGPSPVVFGARAVAPDPTLAAWASSTVAAQRIVTPAWVTLTASVSLPRPLAPTTTVVASPTTTRPRPATTTTRAPSTTTTTRPVSTTTSAATTTSPPAPVTTGPAPSAPGPGPTPPGPTPPQLPVTGADSGDWALVGLGLVLVGAALARMGRHLGEGGPGRRPGVRA